MKSLLLFLIFSVSFFADIYVDLKDNIPLSHIWHEGLLFCLSLAATAWQFKLLLKKDRHIKHVEKELLETKDSYREWQQRSKHSAHEIRNMIDQQFNNWSLSTSEKDIALLLIKGLSMKEIAEIRTSHEKTVRQHATNIYRKANISGRQELAAFFLEDIISQP